MALMNIQYLLDAAALLESHSLSGLPLDLQPSTLSWSSSSSAGHVGDNGFSSSSYSSSSAASGGLFSSASGSSESSSSSRDGVELTIATSGGANHKNNNDEGGRANHGPTSAGAGPPPAQAEPKIMRRFKGKNSRETHNRLEKDRRAYLRECFANLRRVVDIDDPKCSNLAILQSAIRCIQNLKREEKQIEQETASLAKRKIELQQKIGELKRDLSDRNPDPSFDVNLWLKMHVNHAGPTSGATASSDETASVHAWNRNYNDEYRRQRNSSHSPLDIAPEAPVVSLATTEKKHEHDGADAESTSTVSLDENSKEPIFSDAEEDGTGVRTPRRRRSDGGEKITYRYADAPVAVAANLAVGVVPDATAFATLNGAEDAAFATNVNGGGVSSGRHETVIERLDEGERARGPARPDVLVESTPSPVLAATAGTVAGAAAAQNLFFMTPDGKFIVADDRHHQLIRNAGSNYIILQPSSGYPQRDSSESISRDQTASRNNHARNIF